MHARPGILYRYAAAEKPCQTSFAYLLCTQPIVSDGRLGWRNHLADARRAASVAQDCPQKVNVRKHTHNYVRLYCPAQNSLSVEHRGCLRSPERQKDVRH